MAAAWLCAARQAGERAMNPLVFIRLECLKLAAQDFIWDDNTSTPETKYVIEAAKAYEKHVRRGIRNADLGGGCGCGNKSNTVEAQRKRQQLLQQDAKALIDSRIEPMTLAQLVTNYDITFPQDDADRIDATLRKYQLRRNVTGFELAAWVESGLLRGAKGKAYTP